MAKSLTKHTEAGVLYARPPNIEADIDLALAQNGDTLAERAAIADQTTSGYLPSEVLVHLIRDARRRNDDVTMNDLLPHLLRRCSANLVGALRAARVPNADYVREETLGRFAVLFAEDGTGDNPDKLDFFEVRFNQAFAALRTNLVRTEIVRAQHERPLPDVRDESIPASDDEVLARLTNAAFVSRSRQERNILHVELLAAINALPSDERAAVILVHVLGYDEESEDVTKRTAATICGVTGRTVRNYLKRAAKRLSRFEEKV